MCLVKYFLVAKVISHKSHLNCFRFSSPNFISQVKLCNSKSYWLNSKEQLRHLRVPNSYLFLWFQNQDFSNLLGSTKLSLQAVHWYGWESSWILQQKLKSGILQFLIWSIWIKHEFTNLLDHKMLFYSTNEIKASIKNHKCYLY